MVCWEKRNHELFPTEEDTSSRRKSMVDNIKEALINVVNKTDTQNSEGERIRLKDNSKTSGGNLWKVPTNQKRKLGKWLTVPKYHLKKGNIPNFRKKAKVNKTTDPTM